EATAIAHKLAKIGVVRMTRRYIQRARLARTWHPVRVTRAIAIITIATACSSPQVSSTSPVHRAGSADAGVPRAHAVRPVPVPPTITCAPGARLTPPPWPALGAECRREDGALEGPFVRLHPDGAVAVRGRHADDALDGPWQAFAPDGGLIEEGTYRDGRR